MQQMAEPQRGNEVTGQARTRDTLGTRVIIALDRAIYRFAGRWLVGFNLIIVGYAALVVLAPILAALGYDSAARPIYRLFGLFCHQDPDRSFHLFGRQFACCERCAAVYGSMALFGLLFAVARGRARSPRYPELVLLISPVVLDGMAVGAGLYGGNVVMRVVTGTLFGLAVIWLLYPRFDAGFAGMRTRLETLFARLAAQGRAKPLAA
jgi:uncharacterized membrane protein